MATYNGSNFNDLFVGPLFNDGNSDLVRGFGGDDFLGGKDGNDTLDGGSGNDSLFGDSGNDSLVGGSGFDTLFGGSGNDTLVASKGIAFGSGFGPFINHLEGGSGDDVYDLRGLDYTLFGMSASNPDLRIKESSGGGRDKIIVDQDIGLGTAGEESFYAYSIGAAIEDIELTGTGNFVADGNDLSNRITGNSGHNLLIGDGGADTLSGLAGNDTLMSGDTDGAVDLLFGGTGDDRYIIGATDIIEEVANAGIDTAEVRGGSYTLPFAVENGIIVSTSSSRVLNGNFFNNTLTVSNAGSTTATLNGLDGQDTLVGSGRFADTLNGGSGSDSLDGGGGADRMAGGTGNDTFVVDNVGDVVVEEEGGGFDIVRSGVSFSLSAGVENLVLEGTATSGGGNNLPNVITGTSGDNGLRASSNSGTTAGDTLRGGAGNDNYLVRSAADVVEEAANGGNDTITALFTDYVLNDSSLVEQLNLASFSGQLAKGNAFANTINGSAGSDTILGGGGSDSLSGGSGNDLLIDGGRDSNPLDVGPDSNLLEGGDGDDTLTLVSLDQDGASTNIVEGGAGTDTLSADFSGFTTGITRRAGENDFREASGRAVILGWGIEVFNITGGSGSDSLEGGALADQLFGNAGKDRLLGLDGNDELDGGADNDLLIGGNGTDVIAGGDGDDSIVGGFARFFANPFLPSIPETPGANDTIRAGAGNDTIEAGEGSDFVLGEDGDDLLLMRAFQPNTNTFFGGGNGSDTLRFTADDPGSPAIRDRGIFNVAPRAEGQPVLAQPNTQFNDGLGGTIAFLDIEHIDATGTGFSDFLGGLANSDTLDGGSGGADFLDGAEGDDLLILRETGASGVSTVIGGDGEDTLEIRFQGTTTGVNLDMPGGVADLATGGRILTVSGIEVLDATGTVFADTLRGTSGNDSISGDDGGDSISGGGGDDQLRGGSENDRVLGGAGNDVLDGNAGSDSLFGEAGNDRLFAELREGGVIFNPADNDLLDGGAGSDELTGMRVGSDTLRGGDGGDNIHLDFFGEALVNVAGGEGNDTLILAELTGLAAAQSLVIDPAAGSILLGGIRAVTVSGIESFVAAGSSFSDFLTGGGGNDSLFGNDGSDTLQGNAGNDQLSGGSGADSIDGGDGDDSLTGGAGANTLRGGNGNDSMDGSLGAGNVLDGGSGNDFILLGGLLPVPNGRIPDTATGGLGDDTFQVTSEDFNIDGGEGIDILTHDDDFIPGAAVLTGTFTNIERLHLNGGDDNDRLDGLNLVAFGDILSGGNGNDTLNGLAGNDRLIGKRGDDLLAGGAGDDTLENSGFDDFRETGPDFGSDILSGGNGNDLLRAQIFLESRLVADGGNGSDRLQVDVDASVPTGIVATTDTLAFAGISGSGPFAILGFETLHISGTRFADSVIGGAGNDFIDGRGGADVLLGGSGDDTVVATSGALQIDGGSGVDLLRADFGANGTPVSTSFAQQGGRFTLTPLPVPVILLDATGFERFDITGGFGDDVLAGGELDDSLDGGNGNDQVNGNGGNDVISVDVGFNPLGFSLTSDTLEGGLGNDTLAVVLSNPEFGGYRMEAGTISLGSGFVVVQHSGFESLRVTGSLANDSITGLAGADLLSALAGDDLLNGGGGNDTLVAGSGNDTLNGGDGNDLLGPSSLLANDNGSTQGNHILVGGVGNDTLFGGSGNDTLVGGTGVDRMEGGLGDDTYVVDNVSDVVFDGNSLGIEIVTASVSFTLPADVENLSLTGTAAINATGNEAGNRLTGNGASNLLSGLAGNDTLLGSRATGSPSSERDTLTGGSGGEIFVLATVAEGVLYNDGNASTAGADSFALITDFITGQDRLLLKGTAAQYRLGASGIAGETGSGLFFETGATDELVAIIRSGNATALTATNLIATAAFV